MVVTQLGGGGSAEYQVANSTRDSTVGVEYLVPFSGREGFGIDEQCENIIDKDCTFKSYTFEVNNYSGKVSPYKCIPVVNGVDQTAVELTIPLNTPGKYTMELDLALSADDVVTMKFDNQGDVTGTFEVRTTCGRCTIP